jgi:hypothetical protein
MPKQSFNIYTPDATVFGRELSQIESLNHVRFLLGYLCRFRFVMSCARNETLPEIASEKS